MNLHYLHFFFVSSWLIFKKQTPTISVGVSCLFTSCLQPGGARNDPPAGLFLGSANPFYPTSPAMICGRMLACDSIATPDCNNICDRTNSDISSAMSASRICDSEVVAVS